MLEQDEMLKGKYFMLDRVDVHCAWVSQAVLDLLPRDLPDEVPGGEIVRTPGMGVFCDNAMDLVTPLWPKPGVERKKTYIASAMKELHKVGLVGMHDAGVLPGDIAMYDQMSRTDDWTLRVYAMVECPERNSFCPEEAAKVEHPDGMLSVRSVKLFADGALGSWGSAMIEPYSDRPDTRGSLLVNASTLTSLARSWSAAGFQVNIHAIGDLANRLAIDALEASLHDLCPDQEQKNLSACQSRHRFRIEHSQIIHPADQKRMHDIGIIPSIQPTHATSDMAYAALRLGDERIRTEAYRMRSLLDIGPVLGSDFPVEPPNPFEGVYAAVMRKNPRTGRGPPGYEDGWHVEEALSVEQALDGFTRGAAWGAFLEGKAGVIQEGAFGDWVVLDEDIAQVGAEELRHLNVRETWVGGKRVYQRIGGDEGGSREKEDL
ncbi:amidohydrolase 3 [Chaetomium strumarium]|uniref:Amidohydrolase 3 n=1 Tax=Chaetomium strumarium TaxID=1170767 RepID=A0AAJ0GSZ0_9PEZI|nr:amidohydrolase 3 [Chaetomium strumarium]